MRQVCAGLYLKAPLSRNVILSSHGQALAVRSFFLCVMTVFGSAEINIITQN